MRFASAMLAALWVVLLSAAPGAAQVRNNTAGGGGGSLFGSGQSLFGSSQAVGPVTGIGQQGFGAGFGNQAGQQGQQQGGFVGRDSSDTAALFEALNQSGNQFIERIERTFGSRNRGRGVNQADDARPPIRVKLRLGFRPPPTSPANLPTPTAGRLNTLFAEKGFNANATVADGVVVLSGVVAEEADRRMLVRLVQLEPGVHRVDNRLTVTDQTAPNELPAP